MQPWMYDEKVCPFCVMKKSLARIKQVCPSLEDERKIYLESENFVSTVDSHPIVPESPYFLIVPRRHYTSFAQIPVEQTKELSKHIRYLRRCVKRTYPHSKRNLITFEHGQNQHGNQVKSVYHAHWHVIYTDYGVEKVIAIALQELSRLKVDFSLQYCDKINLLPALRQLCGVDYLYLSANNTRIIAVDHGNHGLYSQFFRIIMAQACGITFIDWKDANVDQKKIFAQRLYTSLPQNIRRSSECEN